MSFSAAPPAKFVNGPDKTGPIGPTGDFGLAGAGATNESGFAFENVFEAAASALEDADGPGAEAVLPGDSVENAAFETTPVPILVNADLPPTPIAPPPAGAVDSGRSVTIEAAIDERAGVRDIVASLQADAAVESPRASTAENTAEDQAPSAQPRSLSSQQTEDAPTARRSSPSADQDISGRAIADFADRGVDAARAFPRQAPFGADEARLFTDVRSVDAIPAATAAASAPPGAETSVDRHIGAALASIAGTKEASPTAITIVASRQIADGSIELRLDPPELGSVSIDIVRDETGAVTAVVNADRAETLDLLRRHIDIFKGELARNGFGDVDMTFGDGRQSSDEPPPRARAQQHWANQTGAAFRDYAAFALGEGFDVIA